MKIKDYLKRRIFQKKKADNLSGSLCSDAILFCNYEKKGIPLSSIKDLSTAVHIRGEGKWRTEDFRQLKQILKTGLSPMSANVSLQQMDLSGVIFSEESADITFSGLLRFCVNLTDVLLPDASEYEGTVNFNEAFSGCKKLKYIANLETYRKISNLSATFSYCACLSEIMVLVAVLPPGSKDTFQGTNKNLKLFLRIGVKVPSGWFQVREENITFLPL